jgi:hypothetical protein
MRVELYIKWDDKIVAVLKGAREWVEARAVAYHKAGFETLVIEGLK